MEKQSFELINGMKGVAKVHSLVYEGKESRLHFFRTLNRQILKKLDENPGISVVHYNDALLAAFSLLHRGYTHLKRTATFHGLDVVFPSTIYQKWILPKFNRFDRIVAVSQATADACIKRGIAADKVVVISNGVDDSPPSEWNRDQLDALFLKQYDVDIRDQKILVSMGRAVRRKGFSWFIQQVMPAMADDVTLLMIGPVAQQERHPWYIRYLPLRMRQKMELFLGYPSDEQAIRQLISNPVYGRRVNRLGKLPEIELRAILTHADVFVMPNIEVEGDMEGFGLVCLEAAVCGARVLASASGGITDAIIPHKNGWLVEAGNATAWKSELNLLLDQGIERQLTAADIRNFTRAHYSWTGMCTEYAELFRAVSNFK